jgi:pimeloyl-ACP methyl ester carboxylesterase
VAELQRDDGIRIHWEQRGDSGPLVVLASYWSLHPSVWEPITAELERDHRVVRYDDRHSGRSSPHGPYDLDTAAGDLAAVIEEAGDPAVVVSQADGTNRAVRVAGRRAELVSAIVTNGGIPVGRRHFEGLEALVTSEGVVEALLSQMETDYRGGLRGILTATNSQMSDEELRERVDKQAEHSPGEPASERLRAWAADDPLELGRKAGDRLWILFAEGAGGGWFPLGDDARRLVAELLPDAHLLDVDDGMVSAPAQTADVVRRVAVGATVDA